MSHDSLIEKKPDHFPWITLLIVFLLQAVIGITFAVRDRDNQVAKATEDLQSHTLILESMLLPHLQRSNYEAIGPLLQQWVVLYESQLVSLELTSSSGFSFYAFLRPEGSRHPLEDRLSLPYSYQGEGHLHIVWDLDDQHQVLINDLMLVGLISLVTLVGLSLALNLARQRKRNAEALATEKDLLDATLRQLGEGVVMVDTGLRSVMVNQAAATLVGLPEGVEPGRPVEEFIFLSDEATGDRIRCAELAADHRGIATHDHLVLHRPDGSDVPVRLSCTETRDSRGEPLGLVVILQDRAQTRQLEAERRQVATLQAVGLLAGGIAHDFNNLLTIISGNIQLARKNVPPAGEVAELLREAGEAAAHSAELTQQLLTFSRGGEPLCEDVDPGPLIREAGETALEGSAVTLTDDLPADLWPVFADRSQLRQAVQNLVLNARQAMGEKGRLRITGANIPVRVSEGKHGSVRIEFADSGPGIPPADLEKIFNPYFTTKGEGSGLGLSVVHSIITRHGGKIEVASPAGGGAVFTLVLPAGQRITRAAPTEVATLTRGSGRILIMDDDRAVLHATSKMTESLGYEVLACSHGEEALEIVQAAEKRGEPIDAALLDLTIKEGMGGKEAGMALLQRNPNCRVIIVSGYSDDPILARYQEHGFLAALAKPFLIDKLAQTLADVLQIDPS